MTQEQGTNVNQYEYEQGLSPAISSEAHVNRRGIQSHAMKQTSWIDLTANNQAFRVNSRTQAIKDISIY